MADQPQQIAPSLLSPVRAGARMAFRCPVCLHEGTAWTFTVDDDPLVRGLVDAERLLHTAYTGHNAPPGSTREAWVFPRSPYRSGT